MPEWDVALTHWCHCLHEAVFGLWPDALTCHIDVVLHRQEIKLKYCLHCYIWPSFSDFACLVCRELVTLEGLKKIWGKKGVLRVCLLCYLKKRIYSDTQKWCDLGRGDSWECVVRIESVPEGMWWKGSFSFHFQTLAVILKDASLLKCSHLN